MSKKIRILLLLLLMITIFIPSQAFGVTSTKISIDGRMVISDVSPFIDSQKRTMVPIRFVGEELGYKCDWDSGEKKVTVHGNKKSIRLWSGLKEAEVDGTTIAMDTTAVIVNGRAMVPLRFILENMGLTVYYDSARGTVRIQTGQASESSRELVVLVDDVNIRTGPGVDYSILEKAWMGDVFKILSEKNDWYEVPLANGKSGWIASWLVSFHKNSDLPSRGGSSDGSRSLVDKTIVIDAGHGGKDPGASGHSGLKEKDVALKISLKLAVKLKNQGANVILTRSDDTNLTLEGRAAVANNHQGDIFVSIHLNANPSSLPNGTSVYFYGGVNGQQAVRKKLAEDVQEELVKGIQRNDKGIKEANFAVLRYTLVPSILVETAFISNHEEEKLMGTADFQDKAAQGIANGIEKFLKN